MTTGSAGPGTGVSGGGAAGMLARLGWNEQLIVAGGAAAAIANILGVIIEDWPTDLRFWIVLLASIAAIAVAVTGAATIAGVSGRSWVRIDAALVAAFAFVDLGDTASSLNNWTTLTIVLTLFEVFGAAVLAYAGWAVSGGSLAADVRGVGKVMSLEMTDRFVFVGALGLIVGWFVLMAIADYYSWNLRPQLAVLIGVLILAGRWLDRNPSAGKLPVAYSWLVVGLGAIAVLLGLWWITSVIGDTVEAGSVQVWVPYLIYVLALASLGVGAFLSLGITASKTPPAA
jgi:hypothetical protein